MDIDHQAEKNMADDNTQNNMMHSNDFLSRMIDTTSQCIFWKDTERRFIGVNRAFLDFYGFSSQDVLIGKTDEDMGWHSDPDPFRSDEWRVLKNGESTHRVHGTCVVKGENRDILASKSPLYEDGKIIGLVGSFEDVTNEYRQRDEIRKLTETLDNIPSGICICRMEFGKVIMVNANQTFGSLIGQSSENFEGRNIETFSSLLYPDDLKKLSDDITELVEQDKPVDDVYRFQNKKSGRYQWIAIKGMKARLKNDEEFLYFSFNNENKLKNSENREKALRKMFASSVDTAKLVVWEYDIATHTVTFATTGYTPKRCRELGLQMVYPNVNDYMMKMIAEKYHSEIQRFFAETDAGKAYTTVDVEFKPSTQQMPLFLHLTHVTTYDTSGRPVKAYGTSQDVTREKVLEKQYEQELVFISSTNEKGFVAKGHHDLSANKVLGYYKSSNYVLDVAGLSYDAAFEELKKYIYSEKDRIKYADMFSREHLIARFHNEETYFSMEYRRVSTINSALWVNMEVRTFQNPTTGNIECFIYSYDITEKYLRLLMTNNLRLIGYERVGLISIPEKRGTFYSPHGLNGEWERSELMDDYDSYVRQFAATRVPSAEQQEFIKHFSLDMIQKKLQSAENYVYTCNIFDSRQELRRFYFYMSYLEDDTSVVSVSVQDITKQYHKEQEQIRELTEAKQQGDEANKAKSDFLSRMSHDIRTPLNGIIGMTYLAKTEKDPDKANDYLDKIDTSSKFLLGLVNDVLDMTKIESSRIDLHPEPYTFDQFAKYIDAVVRPLCEEKGQHLIIEEQAVTTVAPLMDILRVNQIFFNLFSNAVKYTQEGGTITYRLKEKLMDDGRLAVDAHVIDNGIGMNAELQKKVFDPFTQGERSDTAKNRGSGLGLAIVKSLIELMGGNVSVQSEPGKGSDFHLTAIFESVPIEFVETDSTDKNTDVDPASGIGRHILLCEDHPLNQEITKTILEKQGMIVTVAGNGEEGVNAFEKSNPEYYDLILMDIRMPIMDGYEATRRIRAMKRKDAAGIPIIAMTADAFADDVAKCREAGMNEHIAKPVDPLKLCSTVLSYMK